MTDNFFHPGEGVRFTWRRTNMTHEGVIAHRVPMLEGQAQFWRVDLNDGRSVWAYPDELESLGDYDADRRAEL